MNFQSLIFFMSSFLLFNIIYGMRIKKATEESIPSALSETDLNKKNASKEDEGEKKEEVEVEKEEVEVEKPKKKEDNFGLNLAVMKYAFRFVTKVFEHSFGALTEKVGDILSVGVTLLSQILPIVPNLLGQAG